MIDTYYVSGVPTYLAPNNFDKTLPYPDFNKSSRNFLKLTTLSQNEKRNEIDL